MEEIIASALPVPEPSADKKKKKEIKDELSIDKMELSLYRAQMAMVRTTTTMTTMGFAIYKLLEEKIQSGVEGPILRVLTPKAIALTLFFAGFVGLITYTVRHFRKLKKIGRFTTAAAFSGLMIMSYILLLLTLLLLIGTLLRPGV